MLLMLQMVDMARWKKRSWIVSSGDGFSESMAGEFEARLLKEKEERGKFEIVELSRARRVHQSLLTTPVTSLICLWAALKLLARDTPDVVLTNGPGTGVIVVLASFILRFFNLAGSGKTRCVYIESLARCKKLSLSGRLLNGFVDRFLVQCQELEKGRVEFKGCFALDAAVGVGMDGVDKRADLHKSEWISHEL
jgi:beta-1,4-N-acetylglucosaminyltransferase